MCAHVHMHMHVCLCWGKGERVGMPGKALHAVGFASKMRLKRRDLRERIPAEGTTRQRCAGECVGVAEDSRWLGTAGAQGAASEHLDFI